MKRIVFCIISIILAIYCAISLILPFMGNYKPSNVSNDEIPMDTIIVAEKEEKETEEDMLKLSPNAENMYKVCVFYGIKFPEIVTSQAVLESGHFRSNIFKTKNNPFGMYNSSKKDWYSYEHWVYSVKDYKNKIEYKYKGGDYYQFLEDMGYAADENYISKLKSVHRSIFL